MRYHIFLTHANAMVCKENEVCEWEQFTLVHYFDMYWFAVERKYSMP